MAYILLCVCHGHLPSVPSKCSPPRMRYRANGLSVVSAKLQLEKESPESTFSERQWSMHEAAAHTPHAQSDTQDTKGTVKHHILASCTIKNWNPTQEKMLRVTNYRQGQVLVRLLEGRGQGDSQKGQEVSKLVTKFKGHIFKPRRDRRWQEPVHQLFLMFLLLLRKRGRHEHSLPSSRWSVSSVLNTQPWRASSPHLLVSPFPQPLKKHPDTHSPGLLQESDIMVSEL